METPTVMKTDIVDIDYLKNILGMLCWYEPKRNQHTFITILQKLYPFWDVLIVVDDNEANLLKQAIKLATKIRLKTKDTAFVRNEILTTFPQLRDVIESQRNKTAIHKDIFNDILAKYKSFAALKFAKSLQHVMLESMTKKETVELYDEINKLIQEFYNEAQLDIASTEIRYSSPDEVEERIIQRIEELTEQEERRSFIPSRISLLNLSLSSGIGYEKGCIYMFGAPTGGGKTRFTISEGAHMFQAGFTVCHITIENSEQKVSDMYDSAILGMSVDEIYKAYRQFYNSEKAKEKVHEIIHYLKEAIQQREASELVIKKFRPLAVTPLMIENYLLSLIADGVNPDVLIIDHVDIVIPNSGRRDNMFQAGEEVVAQIKDIAERYNVCVILPTQLNREGNRKKKSKNPYDDVLSRGDISRSGAKYELVDLFATLNRTPDEKFTGKMRLYIDKNRDGIEDLIIPCRFDTGSMQLEAITSLDELDVYSTSVMIPKSLAVIYYNACKDVVLRERYIDKLKEFYNFLPYELRQRVDMMLTETEYSSIGTSTNCEHMVPYQFIRELMEVGEHENLQVGSVERIGNDVTVTIVDSDGVVTKTICTDIDELSELRNEYDEGDEEYELINTILSAVL